MTRDDGQQFLKSMQAMLAGSWIAQTPAEAILHVEFELVGSTGFDEDDRCIFNAAQALLHIEPLEERKSWILSSRVHVLNDVIRSSDGHKHRAVADAALKQARQFLVALGSAAVAFAVWKSFGARTSLLIEFPRDDTLHRLEYQARAIEIPGGLKLHAGHLAFALKTTLLFRHQEWHDAFVENYENGSTFLLNTDQLSTTLAEAYLSYFRCLEYLVCQRVLAGRRGKFDEKLYLQAHVELAKSFGARVLSESDIRAQGVQLVRKRGESAAHLSSGSSPANLSHQDVADLKVLVDTLLARVVQREPRG